MEFDQRGAEEMQAEAERLLALPRHELGTTHPLGFLGACLDRALQEYPNWTGSLLTDLRKFRGDKAALTATDLLQWGPLFGDGDEPVEVVQARVQARADEMGIGPLTFCSR